MSTANGPVYVLPFRPRLRDWATGGACAGLLLGLADWLVAALGDTLLDPPVALAMFACDALLVALCGLALGRGLRVARLRPSYSATVGAVVGAMLLPAIASALWSTGGLPAAVALRGFAGALALAGVAGWSAARLCDRAEGAGLPVSAPAVWGGVALLLASSTRMLEAPQIPAWAIVAGLSAAVAVAAVGASIGLQRARRGTAHPRARFARLLARLGAVAVVAAYLPWLQPWLEWQSKLPELAPAPPNVLVVALRRAGGDGFDASAGTGIAETTPVLELLAAEGVVYETLISGPAQGIGALLRLSNGGLLVSQLVTNGYATAAILREPSDSSELAAAEIDARPGGLRHLQESAPWMSGTAFLIGPGSLLLSPLGLGATTRSPGQIGAEARRWLLNWRTRRAPSPFFLLVDLRANEPSAPHLRAADASLGDLLSDLSMLGLSEHTVVIVALDGSAGGRGLRSDAPLRVVLRSPAAWSAELPSAGGRPLRASELAGALLRITLSTADRPGGPGRSPSTWRGNSIG